MTEIWSENPGLAGIFQCRQAQMSLYLDKTRYFDLSIVANKLLAVFPCRDAPRYLILSRVSLSGRFLMLGVCSFAAIEGDSGNFKFLMVPEDVNHRQEFQMIMRALTVEKIVIGEVALRKWLEKDSFFGKYARLFASPDQTVFLPVPSAPIIRSL